MITGTLTMISKTLRTPDTTTIQDALNIMQTEAKDIAEETANVIETVKMEMRNDAADIKRSIKIGEETKTAAREAMERSKIVVDIVKRQGTSRQDTRTYELCSSRSKWSACFGNARCTQGQSRFPPSPT
jgi:hypothetical protein